MGLKKISFLVFKWFGIFLLGLVILLKILDAVTSTDQFNQWIYSDILHPKQISVTDSGVRVLTIGDTTKIPLVLIHGAPGGFYDWLNVAKHNPLYEKYYLIIPARPGYGGSHFWPMTSIIDQSNAIAEVLPKGKKSVIMGHSYGGPIALYLAAQHPDKVRKVYGVSGQYDPKAEKTFTISYYSDHYLGWLLMPRFLWTSNREKLDHPAAQTAIIDAYKKITVPVELIHGDQDTLVVPSNSTWVQQKISAPTQLITVKSGRHSLHFEHADLLVERLLK